MFRFTGDIIVSLAGAALKIIFTKDVAKRLVIWFRPFCEVFSKIVFFLFNVGLQLFRLYCFWPSEVVCEVIVNIVFRVTFRANPGLFSLCLFVEECINSIMFVLPHKIHKKFSPASLSQLKASYMTFDFISAFGYFVVVIEEFRPQQFMAILMHSCE